MRIPMLAVRNYEGFSMVLSAVWHVRDKNGALYNVFWWSSLLPSVHISRIPYSRCIQVVYSIHVQFRYVNFTRHNVTGEWLKGIHLCYVQTAEHMKAQTGEQCSLSLNIMNSNQTEHRTTLRRKNYFFNNRLFVFVFNGYKQTKNSSDLH